LSPLQQTGASGLLPFVKTHSAKQFWAPLGASEMLEGMFMGQKFTVCAHLANGIQTQHFVVYKDAAFHTSHLIDCFITEQHDESYLYRQLTERLILA
jgi:hypothetical protein